jgi:hypothetical protein
MDPLRSRRAPRRRDRLFWAHPTLELLELRQAPTGLWDTPPPEHLFAEPLPIAILGEPRPAEETPARPAQHLDGTFPDLQPLLTQLRLAPLAHDVTPRSSSATAPPRPAVTFPAAGETPLPAALLDAGDLLADPFGTTRATPWGTPSGFTLGSPDPETGPDRAAAPDSHGLPDSGAASADVQPGALLTPLSGARDNRADGDLLAALASGTPFRSGGLTLMSPATSSGTELLSASAESLFSAQAAAAPQGPSILVVGPDAGGEPLVKVYDPVTRKEKLRFHAADRSFTGGVRVAVGDLNGDGTDDIVTALGPGGGNLLKVFDGRNGAAFAGPLGSLQAFAPGESDGLFVAVADLDHDGWNDVVAGNDGAGPSIVRAFSGRDASLLFTFTFDASGLSAAPASRLATSPATAWPTSSSAPAPRRAWPSSTVPPGPRSTTSTPTIPCLCRAASSSPSPTSAATAGPTSSPYRGREPPRCAPSPAWTRPRCSG